MENKKKVEKYLTAVYRRLNMPKEYKKRVISDMKTTITARIESGEIEDDIIKDLGIPAETAKEINEQMNDFTYRKSPLRFIFLIIAIITLIWLVVSISFWLPVHRSIGIIGGADGPTSIIVTSSPRNIWGEFITAAVIFAASVLGYIQLRKMKKKK